MLASVGKGDGAPIVPMGAQTRGTGAQTRGMGAQTRGELDPGVFIAEVPSHIVIARSGLTIPRSQAVAWSRAALEAAERAQDPVAALWSLAASLASSGSSGAEDCVARASLAGRAPRPDARAIIPWIRALLATAGRRAAEDAAWRTEPDLARRATRWIEASASALLEPGACEQALLMGGEPSLRTRLEAFYVRATLHGHHLLIEEQPLAVTLRDRAVRLLVARAMERVLELERARGGAGAISAADPAARYPIAIVEAMLRGHGLRSYREDPSLPG